VCGQAESRKERTLNLLNKVVVSASVLLLSVFSVFPSAQAHTDLISSNPAAGANLEKIPESFSLTFNEELISIEGEMINTLSLEDAAGMNYPLSEVKILGEVLTATAISGPFPAGQFKLTYRVVSADGHPINGDIAFSTQSPTTIELHIQDPVKTLTPDPKSKVFSTTSFLLVGLLLLFIIMLRLRWKRRENHGQGN
jgi:copper resistance protein C